MKPILTSEQMKEIDGATTSEHFVPSLVLMERAAMAVVEEIEERADCASACSVLVVAGSGNNGGDGVAIARLLHLKGYQVLVHVLGLEEKYSSQLKTQIDAAKSYGVKFISSLPMDESFDFIIDAIFGIGLSRDVTGIHSDAINYINKSTGFKIAVDIPSGFSADSGKELGVGVKADLTITFAYLKKGLLLSDCKTYGAGEVLLADVGIYAAPEMVAGNSYAKVLDYSDTSLIPERPKNANKGTCGKLLVVSGSESIYGACYLCARAAMATGTGLVKIFTHKNNLLSIQSNLPEAIYYGYDSFSDPIDELSRSIEWADTILIGPGLGNSELSRDLVAETLDLAGNRPLIIDADALNIISIDTSALENYAGPVVITPHLKEMERLSGVKVAEIKDNLEALALDFAAKHNCTVVLKDFTTIIAGPDGQLFYNNSGCEALATAGSGDVLAGICASLVGQKISKNMALTAALAAFLHGRAGERACEISGVRGVLASELIDYIF